MKKSCLYKKILTYTIALAVGGVSLMNGHTILAQERALTLAEVEVTDDKLLKGDRIDIDMELIGAQELTTVTGVEITGEAADKTDLRYQVTNAFGDEKETPIGMGELALLQINGLTYSGKGDTITVVIRYAGGSIEHKIQLDTITEDEVIGALVLDPTVTSNMSVDLKAGESKNVKLTIKNTSNIDMENSIVKINFANTTVGLAVTEGQYTEIRSLKAGATKEISFVVEADSDVPTGVYPVTVETNGMKQTLQLEVGNDTQGPAITMTYDAKQHFEVGKVTPIKLVLENVGDQTAKDLKVSVENKEGLSVIGSSNVTHVGEILPYSQKAMTVDVFVDDSVETDVTTLELKVSYTTEKGDKVEEIQRIALNTEQGTTENSGEVTIEKMTEGGTLGVEESFNIGFSIASDGITEDVKVTVTPPEGIVASTQNVFMVPELEVGKNKDYSVILLTTEGITEGYHPIEIAVEYTYDGEKIKTTQYSGVTIVLEEEASEESGIPKVIVDTYVLEPAQVSAGNQVMMQVSLRNTHAEKAIRNLTATYAVEGNEQVFAPVNTGNTLFTQSIQPGGVATQKITLEASKEASNQNYPIELLLEYEDEEGEKITMTQQVTIPVVQQGMIQVGTLDQTELVQGKSNALTIPLYNRGQSALENVMISLQGEGFTVEDNELYISSFDKGATEYYLPTVTPTQEKVQVVLSVQYEDQTGTMQEVEYPLDLQVASGAGENTEGGGRMPQIGGGKGMPSQEDLKNLSTEQMKELAAKGGISKGGMGAMTQEPESESSPWMPIGIGAGLIVGGAVAFKVVKSRKKAKELEGHEEL